MYIKNVIQMLINSALYYVRYTLTRIKVLETLC